MTSLVVMGAIAFGGHSVGAYEGVPILPGTPEDVKLRKAIQDVATQWNTPTASRLTAMANAGRICVETGSTNDPASALGEGECATINIKLSLLCDPIARVWAFLHEIGHTTFAGSGPEEHCRVTWLEYRHVRNQAGNHNPGTPERNALDDRAGQIERWYTNFDAAFAAGGVNGDAPAPTPIPGNDANGCQTAMRSIQPPTGGPVTVTYTIAGTDELICRSWEEDAVSTPSEVVFELPCDRVTDMRLTELASGEHALVLTGTNATGTDGAVYAVVDGDDDGFLDTIDTVVAFGSGLQEPGAVHNLTNAAGDVTWYVLDAADGKVRSRVTDASGLPDGLDAVFATTTTSPMVSDAVSLMSVPERDASGAKTGDEILALSSIGALYRSEAGWGDWWLTLEDTDADGAADLATGPFTYGVDVVAPPFPVGGARDGDAFVLVGGVPGHTVQVLGWNASTAEHDILLGSGVVGVDRTGCVAVSPDFDADQTYVLSDTDTGATTVAFTPPPTGSTQIVGFSPSTGSSSGGQVVTIEGFGLPSNPDVFFGTLAGTVIHSSDTQILVVTPDHGADRNLDLDVVVRKGSSETVAHLMFHTDF